MKAKLKVTVILDVKSNHDDIKELIEEFEQESYYGFEDTESIRILNYEFFNVETEVINISPDDGKFCCICDKLAGLDGTKEMLYEIEDPEDGKKKLVCGECYDLVILDD